MTNGKLEVETVYKDGFCALERNQADNHIRLNTTDSVAVFIYNIRTENIIFVKQDRFAMVRKDNPEGTIIETPAGRFDYKVELIELIINEVREETGVTLTADQILILNSGIPLAESPGVLTERIHLAFAAVDVDETEGLGKVYGVDGERIERFSVPASVLEDLICYDLKTFALVQWFLRKVKDHGYGYLSLGLARLADTMLE